MSDLDTNTTVVDSPLEEQGEVESATSKIEGLLDLGLGKEDYEPEESTDEDSSEDAAPEETSASEHETDAPEHEHAISAPQSWSAEDRKLFDELPPEARAIISRRESERDRAISQKLNEVAAERKAYEAEAHRINQMQTDYARTVNQMLNMVVPELQQYENVNWQELARTDPAKYVQLSAERDGLRQQVSRMQNEAQIAQAQVAQQAQQQMAAHLTNQVHVLQEMVPEFRDPTQAKNLVQSIAQTMNGYGFNDQEIGSIADARIVKVLARLTQLEAQEAARKSAQGKKGGAPAPRYIAPNATPDRGDNKSKKIQEQYAALKKSGSTEDATRLLANLL